MSATPLAAVRTIAELRAKIREWRKAGLRIGFAPTMGALHEGHLSLVRAAKQSCDRVVVSIFVNPTQFGPNEDFDAYPRNEAADLALLAGARADLVYLPSVGVMYPKGASTTVTVTGITEGLCGVMRPGHFQGVATVVTKLLLQVLPDAAFFGEKDYQQLKTITRMARDLDIPCEIIGVPTVREADGLALSSRNVYLSQTERQNALALPRTMQTVAARLRDGSAAAAHLEWGRAELMRGGFDSVDYLELCDADDLMPLSRLGERPARLIAAVRIGKTRLIDNISASF